MKIISSVKHPDYIRFNGDIEVNDGDLDIKFNLWGSEDSYIMPNGKMYKNYCIDDWETLSIKYKGKEVSVDEFSSFWDNIFVQKFSEYELELFTKASDEYLKMTYEDCLENKTRNELKHILKEIHLSTIYGEGILIDENENITKHKFSINDSWFVRCLCLMLNGNNANIIKRFKVEGRRFNVRAVTYLDIKNLL